MRIALTADPEIPVPPRFYGGIERIVDLLARGLTALGHDVTLFAHALSNTGGKLVQYRGTSSRSIFDNVSNTVVIASKIIGGNFDLVHSFSRIAYLAPILPLPIPKLMTYQRVVTKRSIYLGHWLSRGTLHFSGVSRNLVKPVESIGSWHIVYNGVCLRTYEFVAEARCNAPLVFLGRIEPIKGAHIAIEIARSAGLSLVIAGNVPDQARSYFESVIKPNLDGRQIVYVGPVDDARKSALLGNARALLMPITWEEPFGIVMAEALACGTPVLGFDRGAVSEIVEDGVTGFVRDDVEGLIKAVPRISEIDRSACRRRAEALFSGRAVVDGYLSVYDSILNSRRRDATT